MMKLILSLSALLLGAQAFASTYVQPCRVENSDDYLEATLLMQNNWTWRETAYEDSGCQLPYLVYERVYAPAEQGANLNLTVQSASYTSLTDTTTDSLNGISWCGFSDWQTNVAKNVTGKTCEDYQVPAVGDVIYSIIKTDGSNLWLGEESQGHDGSTEAERYSQLVAQPFALQQ
jgi:hypothetical protein